MFVVFAIHVSSFPPVFVLGSCLSCGQVVNGFASVPQ